MSETRDHPFRPSARYLTGAYDATGTQTHGPACGDCGHMESCYDCSHPTPQSAEAVEQHGHWYDGVPGVWASDVAPDGFCDQCRPEPTEAVAAMDRALDGAMATAGLAVKPSHYSRHVLTRLSEQGFALTRDHARCEALREQCDTCEESETPAVEPSV